MHMQVTITSVQYNYNQQPAGINDQTSA